nr:Gag-Pol polyprotein [Tanacetum cinerariifolium]
REVTTSNELDLPFSLMFDELLNGSTQVVSKSSDVTTADAPNKCQQQHTTPLNTQTTPEPTCQVPTQAPTVTSTENINQVETIIENAQVKDNEFINIFCTPVQERGETSSHHEEVYVNHPDGFVDPYHPDKVYRLKKALYGLKQSSKGMSSVVSTADAPNQRQHHTTPLDTQTTPAPTCQVPPHAPTVASNEYMNQAKMVEEYAHVENDEFINIFCTPVQDQGETSSRHVDSSNMHTFYQHHPSEHRWTKDHPLEQVIGNPSQSVRTRHSDHAGCLDSRKSTSGVIQFLGGDKLVSWSSKKQDCTSMSFAEAESNSVGPGCLAAPAVELSLTSNPRAGVESGIIVLGDLGVDAGSSASNVSVSLAGRIGSTIGVETPLFEGMLVAAEIEEQNDAEEQIQGDDNDAAQGADADVSGDDVQDQFIPSPAPPTPPPPPQDIPSTS